MLVRQPPAFFFTCDITQDIPTLALSKSGSRSKVIPSSQPVTQAPVSYIVLYVLSLLNKNHNTFVKK